MSDQSQFAAHTLANIQAAVPAQGGCLCDRQLRLLGDGTTSGGAPSTSFSPCMLRPLLLPRGPLGTATVPVAANRLLRQPVLLVSTPDLHQVGIEITTAAGTNGRLGI